MEDKHFDKVFYFICGIGLAVFLFDCAVIFVPVPQGGSKYADILVGALNTGILMAGVQYLLGGTPKAKTYQPLIQQTGDAPIANAN